MKTQNRIEVVSTRPADSSAEAKAPPTQPAGRVFRRILLGTDFSPASASVFEHGLKLARDNGAELLIAHAEAFPDTLSFMPSANYDEWNTLYRADAKKQIGALVEQARGQGVHCHALVLTALPADALVDVARKLKVDLIVIGTHGRKGFARLWSGSVASRIVAHAPCSVLTVHPAAK